MTATETAIIQQLITDIGEWREQTHSAIAEAIANHETTCLQRHLEPLSEKLDRLLQTEQDRSAAERERARLAKFTAWLIGLLAGMVGLVGGIIAIANGIIG